MSNVYFDLWDNAQQLRFSCQYSKVPAKKECLNIKQKLGHQEFQSFNVIETFESLHSFTHSLTHSRHAERLLFSCLCSKVTPTLSLSLLSLLSLLAHCSHWVRFVGPNSDNGPLWSNSTIIVRF